jgi:predicted ATPase
MKILGELRKALGETAQAPRCIQTVHRRGYRFVAPVTVTAPPATDLEAGPRPGLGALRERMLREAAECLEAVSAEQPLVLVLEDLHWSDHATLDLLTWLAQRLQEPGYLVEAHRAMGPTLFFMGEPATARTHLEQSLALYHPEQHREHAGPYGFDPKVISLNYLALTLWILGYPDHAARHAQETLRWARELAHLPSLTHAMFLVTCFHVLARDVQHADEQAVATIRRASEHELALYMALGTLMRGWAVAMQGQGEAGLALLRQDLAAYRATGAVRGQPMYLGLLAEAYGEVGQAEAGLCTLAEALAGVHDTGDCFYEAELHRLKGTLWLRQPVLDESQAEAFFHQALAIARRQQGRSLELRAAMSLARLWQRQGQRTAAYELLAPVYAWFTEGFDTSDLQEAKALLKALGEGKTP